MSMNLKIYLGVYAIYLIIFVLMNKHFLATHNPFVN